jgi:glucose-1-phosphate cytidylyltransferase
VKVVLFCGGMGVRMGEATQRIPKPMIPVGSRPILWHIMKYYAAWGHTDFILCLGYKAEEIKAYFLHYNEALANDFILSNGGRDVDLLRSDIDDWRITFVDTGIRSTIAERLLAVRRFLQDEAVFLATYGDGLTDAPLPQMLDQFHAQEKTGMLVSVRPTFNAHVVFADKDGTVSRLEDIKLANVRINGGYFIFRSEIFDVIEPGDELVEEPFARLIERGALVAYAYDGFWAPMDTLKDKQYLDGLVDSGKAPWQAVGQPETLAETLL